MIPKPSQLPAVVPKPVSEIAKISDKDLDSACSSLGLVRFRAKTLKALKTLGSALESTDVARIQAANVVITQEKLNNLMAKLESIIDSSDDDQSTIEAIRAATAVCAESNRSCEIAVKVLETKLLEKEVASRKHRGFAPGEIVQPIQVNVTTTGEVKVDSAGT